MGCEEMKARSSFSNVTVVKKSKGNIFTEKPIFWDNGNSLIVSSGQSLHMYSTSTGNHLKELFQCPENVISYQLHPLHDSQLIVISENGELIVFNLKSNEIEYSLKLRLNQKFLKKQKAPKFNLKDEKGNGNFDWEKQSLDSLSERKFLHANVRPFLGNPLEIFVWASWCLNDELQCHVSAFTFDKGKHIRLIHIQKSGLRKCNLNFVLGTVQQYEVFVGMSTHYIHITRYDAQKHPFSIRHYTGHERKVTCLAFHPEECSFATGDSYGRIIIWKNIFENQPLKEILHWHTLPVHDLFFSRFGNYLFSGGEENVLVKWALNSSGKDFLPRLSSTIHHIIGDYESSLLSVSTMDNRILIVDFNFQNVSAVQHFSKWSLLRGECKLNVFTVDPKNSCLVLNGKTGHIQFLSLNEDGKFIYTFDVTNRNFITDADTRIVNTEVTHAKFSKSGRWLITAESRTEEDLCKESRLKFWLFCEKQNSFMLNTNIEFPHEESGIFSLEISADDVVATTGGDRKFRLWSVFESEQIYRKKEFWALHSVKKYRSLTCYGTDFSKDASLVAVTFGPVVTVWETESCELKCSLSIPYRKDVLKFCKFGNHELSYLLVTGSEFYISSWDIITLSVKWTVPLKLSLLISDPFTTYMVAFTKKDSSLVIFNPSSPTPYLIIKKVSDFPVVAAQCVQRETGTIGLYFLTLNQELYCLEDEEKSCASISNDFVQTFSTPYSLQLAERQNQAEASERKTVLLNKSNKQTGFLLDSPSHTLPNPSLICSDILKGLLLFSKNHSAGTSFVKEVKEEVVKIIQNSENSDGIDSVKLESKLLDIVKTIFL